MESNERKTKLINATKYFNNKYAVCMELYNNLLIVGFSSHHKNDNTPFNKKKGKTLALEFLNQHKDSFDKNGKVNIIYSNGFVLDKQAVNKLIYDYLFFLQQKIDNLYKKHQNESLIDFSSPVMNYFHPRLYEKLDLVDFDPTLILNALFDKYIVNSSELRMLLINKEVDYLEI